VLEIAWLSLRPFEHGAHVVDATKPSLHEQPSRFGAAPAAPAIDDDRPFFRTELGEARRQFLKGDVHRAGNVIGTELFGRADVEQHGPTFRELARCSTFRPRWGREAAGLLHRMTSFDQVRAGAQQKDSRAAGAKSAQKDVAPRNPSALRGLSGYQRAGTAGTMLAGRVEHRFLR
jgi:hypothetical protein